MNDFQKALAALHATDVNFIAPITPPAQSPPRFSPRIRRSIRRTPNPGADADTSNPKEPTTNTTSMPTTNNGAGNITTSATPAPANQSGAKGAGVDVSASSDTVAKPSHTRQHIDHEWPPVGAIVSGNYFGTIHRAQVVKANKPLKSGRQLKLLDGPNKGKRFDTFTRALLAATAKQREKLNLGRKQASNGWGFWVPETPSATAASK